MRAIDVRIPNDSQEASYKIFLGSGLLAGAGDLVGANKFSKVFVLADSGVEKYARELAAKLGNAGICVIAGGEDCKKTIGLKTVWEAFQKAGLDRKSLVMNLGGGALGDLAGFAAATYMRGIKFVQMPTTLLAQVDASIGGKVAINTAGVKNLVGAFAQPHAVIIDIDTLRTLPERELNAGFAEILKHGLIADRKYFEAVAAKRINIEELLPIIERSCEIKAGVVEKDEKEEGLRKILNFGHTAGHAIESLSHLAGTPLLHGEAVALGMIVEAKLSQIVGLLSADSVGAIEAALAKYDLPTRTAIVKSATDFMRLAAADKKNVGGNLKWTLLESIGSAIWDKEAPAHEVETALQQILK